MPFRPALRQKCHGSRACPLTSQGIKPCIGGGYAGDFPWHTPGGIRDSLYIPRGRVPGGNIILSVPFLVFPSGCWGEERSIVSVDLLYPRLPRSNTGFYISVSWLITVLSLLLEPGAVAVSVCILFCACAVIMARARHVPKAVSAEAFHLCLLQLAYLFLQPSDFSP
jgi:hypothetical protein